MFPDARSDSFLSGAGVESMRSSVLYPANMLLKIVARTPASASRIIVPEWPFEAGQPLRIVHPGDAGLAE